MNLNAIPTDHRYAEKTPACNHCGLCCLSTPCQQVKELLGYADRQQCPALEWADDNPVASRCGLLAHPERYFPAHMLPAWLSVPEAQRLAFMDSGTGCSMRGRVLAGGRMMEFALLPDAVKLQLAAAARAGLATVKHRTETAAGVKYE